MLVSVPSANSYSTADINSTNGGYVGGLIGTIDGAVTVGNSYSTGNVSTTNGDYVGGLAGFNNGGMISNSYSTGSVSGRSYLGGLTGRNDGTISYSYSTGDVSSTNGGYVGGLAGKNNTTIEKSYSTGNITGTANYAGGLVGYNDNFNQLEGYGVITDSYSTGSVNVTGNNIGGLAGYTYYGFITNSYSTGSVSGTNYVGGLMGYNDNSTITSSYWDTQTSGKSNCTGFGSDAGCTGLTTSQMKQQASFSGWSIANSGGSSATWRIYEGDTYPMLRGFLTALTVTANNDSKTYDGNSYSGGSGVSYSLSNYDSNKIFGAVTYSGDSQGAVNAGSYTITPSGLYSNQHGYDIAFANGTLTINESSGSSESSGDSGSSSETNAHTDVLQEWLADDTVQSNQTAVKSGKMFTTANFDDLFTAEESYDNEIFSDIPETCVLDCE